MAGECQGEDDLNKKIGKINSNLFGCAELCREGKDTCLV